MSDPLSPEAAGASLAGPRQSEERYRAIVETARDYAIFTTDPEGRIEAWPPGAQEVFGWTAEEAIGQLMDMTYTPEDRAAGVPEQERRQARETGQAPNVRWHLRSDGGLVFIEGVARPLTGADGALQGFVKVGQDVTGRRATEAALRESEAHNAALLSQASAGIAATDAQGRFTFVNDRYCAMLGRSLEELLGLTVQAVTHPDDHAANLPLFEKAAAGGPPFAIEKRYVRPDGSLVWVRNSVTAILDAAGAFQSMLAVSVDISDRVAAEAARRATEAALRELNSTLEARMAERTAERDQLWTLSEDMLARADYAGMMSAVSPAWTRVLGWSEAELLSRPYATFMHPEDMGPTLAALTRMGETGQPARFENRIATKDGAWTPIQWTVAPELNGAHFIAVGRDVTDERQREAALRAMEAARREADALYRAYFENTAEALFVVDVLPDGGFTIEDLNPAHQASIGLPLGEVRGRRLDEVLPAKTAKLVMLHYRRALESGGVTQYRETFELHGRATHWDTVLVPVRDGAGRIVRLIGSSRDLSRQMAAEEALRQSQKMEAMGQLTGGVAHDFNNLLTPIIGSLDRLVTRGLGNERERRLMTGALESAERAKTLVQRLLAFARRQPLQPVAVDVGALVEDMAGLIGSTLGPTIDVRVELAPDLPPAHADANQLEMALLNLAVNARDAMPEGGRLTVAASRQSVLRSPSSGLRPGHYVRLSVADTGAGMDDATRKRAVEPFFSTKGVGQGTGLGLSMVHGLAAQLGGGLAIRSAPGQGTTVELWLPISADRVHDAEGAPSASSLVQARGRALLVDDEPLVRMSTADMLTDLGFDVAEAGTAEEALRLLRNGIEVDLLVTDHLMPGLSGAELAQAARRLRPDLPVLIVSGYAEVGGIAPDLPRLVKPFRVAELIEQVTAIMPGAAPPDRAR